MLIVWGVGFVVYQLVNPGGVPGWSPWWAHLGTTLHVAGHPWASASILSFAVAVVLAYPLAVRAPLAQAPLAGQTSH